MRRLFEILGDAAGCAALFLMLFLAVWMLPLVGG